MANMPINRLVIISHPARAWYFALYTDGRVSAFRHLGNARKWLKPEEILDALAEIISPVIGPMYSK